IGVTGVQTCALPIFSWPRFLNDWKTASKRCCAISNPRLSIRRIAGRLWYACRSQTRQQGRLVEMPTSLAVRNILALAAHPIRWNSRVPRKQSPEPRAFFSAQAFEHELAHGQACSATAAEELSAPAWDWMALHALSTCSFSV